MKVKIDYIEVKEALQLFNNRFFTQEQINEIERA